MFNLKDFVLSRLSTIHWIWIEWTSFSVSVIWNMVISVSIDSIVRLNDGSKQVEAKRFKLNSNGTRTGCKIRSVQFWFTSYKINKEVQIVFSLSFSRCFFLLVLLWLNIIFLALYRLSIKDVIIKQNNKFKLRSWNSNENTWSCSYSK